MTDRSPTRNLAMPSILKLPLEIRQMIYALVQILPRSIAKHTEIARPSTGSYLFTYGSPKSRYFPFERLTLSGLRGTNRQLYQETSDFITYPRLFVRMVDNSELRKWSIPALETFMSNKFALDNIVTIQIHLAANGKCLKNPLAGKWNRDNIGLESTSAVGDALQSFASFYTRSGTAVAPKPFSLKRFIKVMEACPTLDFVFINTDIVDLFDQWEDPVGDFEAFVPLLLKNIRVHILQQSIRGKEVELNARFLELLKLMPQYGNNGRVFLDPLFQMQASLRLRAINQAQEVMEIKNL